MASNVDLRGQGNRHHHTAQVSFLSETFTFTQLNASNGPYTIGNLPAGAQILRASFVTAAAFSAATTIAANGLTVGGSSLATAAATITAVGVTPEVLNTAAANVTTEQSAVAVTFTGGGALTTGSGTLVVEYATVHGTTGQF